MIKTANEAIDVYSEMFAVRQAGKTPSAKLRALFKEADQLMRRMRREIAALRVQKKLRRKRTVANELAAKAT